MSRPVAAGGPAGVTSSYWGVSRDRWPRIEDTFWSSESRLPDDIRAEFKAITLDPQDHLHLRTTRSAQVLERFARFVRDATDEAFDGLAIDVDADLVLPPCDQLDVVWLGYEPCPRGEWSPLSVLHDSELLAPWLVRVNDKGLLPTPEACSELAADYQRFMHLPGGPEPIADDACIDVLRIGIVPSIQGRG